MILQFRQLYWEPTDGGVVDVVVGSNHAQVQRSNIHLILYADALGLFQVM